MSTGVPGGFITSLRVESSGGGHEYVTVWIRGANVGTLCVGKRLPECPNPACINARLLARGAPGYRRSFHRMDAKLLEARELFRAVLRGAVPVSVADGIQAWLASPFPKRWPPPDFPTEDEVLAMEREVLARPPPQTADEWRQLAADVDGAGLSPSLAQSAREHAARAEHLGSDERAEAD